MEDIVEDDHINEDFLSWMMLDIESRGPTAATSLSLPSELSSIPPDLVENYGDSGDRSSPENSEKIDEISANGGRLTGQKRKVSRSRELAKESRMRQRLRMQETEKRIAELRSENAELQAHLQNVTQRTTEVQRQRLDMERIMAEKLRDASFFETNSKDLEELLRKFVDLYADYGSYRQKEVAFHLGQLERLILPTQTTKMIVWAVLQDPKFYEIDRSPLFKSISSEVELSAEQTEKIKQEREKAKMFLELLQECVVLMRNLKVAIEKKHTLFDRACGAIMTEATPPQNVKFLLWITRNAEQLSKVIPDFKRSVPHVPQAPILSNLERS